MKKIILKEPEDGAVALLLPAEIRDYLKKNKPLEDAGSFDWTCPGMDGTEHSRPLPVTLRFRAEGVSGPVRVFLSRDERFAASSVRETKCNYVRFTNLETGAKYYWKAEAEGVSSPVFSFTTEPAPFRLIHVDGVSNVRDLGGKKGLGGRMIRQGMVFRGSEPDTHQCITAAGRKTLTEELGVRSQLDLRGEAAGRVHESALGSSVNRVFLPCNAYGEFLLPEYGGTLRAIFSFFADSSVYPVYLHCWGGADRTGTVSFLLEALLGVSDDELMQDYELTSFSVWGYRSRKNLQFQHFLYLLDEYEGASYAEKAENCLLKAGVTEAEIAAIRALLLEGN